MNYSGLYNKITLSQKSKSFDFSVATDYLQTTKKHFTKFVLLMADYANQFGQGVQDFAQPHVDQVKKTQFKKPNMNLGNNFDKFKKYLSRRNLAIGGGFVLLFFFILIVARSLGNRQTSKPQVASATDTSSEQTIQVNRLFEFPLTDNTGEEISTIDYELTTAQLTDDIYIQGQPAKAVDGRTFLVLSLKITNDYDQDIEIDTRDYIRVKLDSLGEELLAADMHSDPLDVQAISTKYTRLGFSIPEEYGNIKLLVGEIKGDKEELTLEFN